MDSNSKANDKKKSDLKKPGFYHQPIGAGMKTMDIPSGSEVNLHLHDGNIQHGTVFKNPKYSNGRNIQLLNSRRLTPSNKNTKPLSGVLEFTAKEIYKVEILTFGNVAKPLKPEVLLQTFVVDKIQQLRYLRRVLMQGTKEVGVKIFTENYGRFAKAFWVLLCTNDTIIPVNVEAILALGCDLWEVLKECLFENNRIMKVIHNSRLETDFLFHTKGIKMVNIFDTQVSSFYIAMRHKLELEEAAKTYPAFTVSEKKITKMETDAAIAEQEPQVELLSTTLEAYLGEHVLGRELALMHDFENIGICMDSPYAVQPMPEGKTLKYMALCVKYLIPLKEKMVQEYMRGFNNCIEIVTDMMKGCDVGQAATALLHEEKGLRGLPDIIKEHARPFAYDDYDRFRMAHDEYLERQLD